MPSAQVVDLTPPPSSEQPPTPSFEKASWWVKYWLWWKHHRFISATLLCVIVAMATIMVVGLPHQSGQPLLTLPFQQPVATITPTPDQGQLTQEKLFYAALPQTLLYYSYAQTTNSQNIYQSDPTNDHRRGLTIGLPNKYSYATSPDGQQILRWSDTTLEVSTQPDLEKFNQLFAITSDQMRINSVIWSTDSKSVAYNLSQATNEQTGGLGQTYKNALYTLALGQKPHLVLNQTKLFQYYLLGYTQPQQLYYAEESYGALSTVNQLDPTSGQVLKTYSFLPNPSLSNLVFSADMGTAVGISQTQVTLYNLSDQTSKIVYTLDRSCAHSNQLNSSTITAVAISRDASKILWATHLQPCFTSSTDINMPTDSLTTYDTAHQLTSQIWIGQRVSPVIQLIWPNSTQWVWVSSTELSQLLDLSSGKLYSVPKQREQNQGKDRVYYIGWLLGNKGEDATPLSSPSPGS